MDTRAKDARDPRQILVCPRVIVPCIAHPDSLLALCRLASIDREDIAARKGNHLFPMTPSVVVCTPDVGKPFICSYRTLICWFHAAGGIASSLMVKTSTEVRNCIASKASCCICCATVLVLALVCVVILEIVFIASESERAERSNCSII